jgi:hypothetical protein
VWAGSHSFGWLIHGHAFRQLISRLLNSFQRSVVKEEIWKKKSKCSKRGNWLPDACCHRSSRIIWFNHVSITCYAKHVFCLSLVYRLLLCKDTVTSSYVF